MAISSCRPLLLSLHQCLHSHSKGTKVEGEMGGRDWGGGVEGRVWEDGARVPAVVVGVGLGNCRKVWRRHGSKPTGRNSTTGSSSIPALAALVSAVGVHVSR